MSRETIYRDPTDNNFPNDYDFGKVDSRIKLRTNAIRTKMYGKDVRGALAESVEIAGEIVGDAGTLAADTATRQDDVESKQAEAVARIENAISSSTDKDADLSEVKDARTDAKGTTSTTLKARLDTMPDLADIAYTASTPGLVQDYGVAGVSSQLKAFADSITADTGVAKILFLTDMHYFKGNLDAAASQQNPSQDYTAAGPLVIDMLKNMAVFDGNIDCAVANGDNIHGHEFYDMNVARNKILVGTLRDALSSTDVFITPGNHDDGAPWYKTKRLDKGGLTQAAALSKADLLSIYDYDHHSFGETREGFTAYKDYPAQKLRVLSIAGFDNPEIYQDDGVTIKYSRAIHSVFTQDQLLFIKQALTVPDDYHVIIFNHSPIQGYFNNTPYTDDFNVNHDLLNGMLQAFASRTKFSGASTNSDYPAAIDVDFTGSTGVLVGIICGHEHRDKDMQDIGGVKSVERLCFIGADRGDDATKITADDLGTVRQYGFDVIEVDTAGRKVNFKRFGDGSDYSYDY